MKIDNNLRELFDMANIMNSGINGQISDLFAGFGIQVQNNLKDALLGLCSDLEIDAGTFKKTWDENYSMTTGVILGDAVVVKKEHAEKKEQANTRKKPVGKSAYHCYLAKWREAKKDGDDTRSFADVRSDWGNLSQEDKDSYKSEDSSPAAAPAPSPAPEPEQAEAEEEEIVDNSIPKINGVPLIEKEWTVAKLKVELKARSLKQSGKKSELVQRLIDSFSQDDESEEEESDEDEDESDSSDDESEDEEEESDEEDEGDIDDIENAVDDIIKQVTANSNNDEEQLSDEDISDEE